MNDEFKKLDLFVEKHKPLQDGLVPRELKLASASPTHTKSLFGGSLLALSLATFFIFQSQQKIVTDEADLLFLEENLAAPITNDEFPDEVLEAMEMTE